MKTRTLRLGLDNDLHMVTWLVIGKLEIPSQGFLTGDSMLFRLCSFLLLGGVRTVVLLTSWGSEGQGGEEEDRS